MTDTRTVIWAVDPVEYIDDADYRAAVDAFVAARIACATPESAYVVDDGAGRELVASAWIHHNGVPIPDARGVARRIAVTVPLEAEAQLP